MTLSKLKMSLNRYNSQHIYSRHILTQNPTAPWRVQSLREFCPQTLLAHDLVLGTERTRTVHRLIYPRTLRADCSAQHALSYPETTGLKSGSKEREQQERDYEVKALHTFS